MIPTFVVHDTAQGAVGQKKIGRVRGKDRDMFKLVRTSFLEKAVPKSRAVL